MRTQQGLRVPNGEHRFEGEPEIWGAIPLQVKVSADDTDGALFVFEHARMGKGGPPRHFHHERDEWFHVIEGDFAFEVGDERFALRPGDSLLAPRMVPPWDVPSSSERRYLCPSRGCFGSIRSGRTVG